MLNAPVLGTLLKATLIQTMMVTSLHEFRIGLLLVQPLRLLILFDRLQSPFAALFRRMVACRYGRTRLQSRSRNWLWSGSSIIIG